MALSLLLLCSRGAPPIQTKEAHFRYDAAHMDASLSHPPVHEQRRSFWSSGPRSFDVVVIGAGIQGACIYHHLVHSGYRVLLVDQGDFGGATSQASAMLIWGGLLYLRNGELAEVWRLCRARQKMLRELSEWVEPSRFRYVLGPQAHRSEAVMHTALWLYWMMAGGGTGIPRRQRQFEEQAFLSTCHRTTSFAFEEAALRESDARFVLRWIHSYQNAGSEAVNYFSAEDGKFDASTGQWRLEMRDTFGDGALSVTSSVVVNAAGVWADAVNARFALRSPFEHVFSKGVSLSVARPAAHRDVLVFDSCVKDEGLSFRPWGPVSLWGSTETPLNSLSRGFDVEPSDVTYLLDHLNAHLASPISPQQIIALRCGARPLAVRRGADGTKPLGISRRSRLYPDPALPWVTIYGGKITGCREMATQVCGCIASMVERRHGGVAQQREMGTAVEHDHFPGLEQPMPSAAWCRDHEQCLTLHDYLRRRTNIAQWTPRGGLGRHDEHLPVLRSIATTFHDGDAAAADRAVRQYRQQVVDRFDTVIEAAGRESKPAAVSRAAPSIARSPGNAI